MITKNNEFLEEAAETAYQLSAEEAIRLQCEAREDYYRQQRYVEQKIASLTKENEEIKEKFIAAKQENTSIKQENVSIKQENVSVKEELARLREELNRLQALLEKRTEG